MCSSQQPVQGGVRVVELLVAQHVDCTKGGSGAGLVVGRIFPRTPQVHQLFGWEVGEARHDALGRFVAGDETKAGSDRPRWEGLVVGEDHVEDAANGGHVRVVEFADLLLGRQPRGQAEFVGLPQGETESAAEPQEDVAARSGAAGLQETDVAGGAARLEGEVKLAEPPAASPRPKQSAERSAPHDAANRVSRAQARGCRPPVSIRCFISSTSSTTIPIQHLHLCRDVEEWLSARSPHPAPLGSGGRRSPCQSLVSGLLPRCRCQVFPARFA